MPQKYNFIIEKTWKDKERRILLLTLKLDDKQINLVNVYAPTKNKPKEQKEFYNTLYNAIHLSEFPLIIGGDMNTYLNPDFDKAGGKTEELSMLARNIQWPL